jgi:hypothetical protein
MFAWSQRNPRSDLTRPGLSLRTRGYDRDLIERRALWPAAYVMCRINRPNRPVSQYRKKTLAKTGAVHIWPICFIGKLSILCLLRESTSAVMLSGQQMARLTPNVWTGCGTQVSFVQGDRKSRICIRIWTPDLCKRLEAWFPTNKLQPYIRLLGDDVYIVEPAW